MNIKQTFLQLTSKTYPYGFEDELEKFLPKGFEKDYFGNYFYKLGTSKTAFTCHLDTASKDQVAVKHVIEGNIIKTDGKSILGADDKAGVTILLWMIKRGIPGLYCFFVGEEVGCLGSKAVASDESFANYKRMISFDRRGTTSVITHQSGRRCCSDKFADSLKNELNKSGLEMKRDDGGVYTDSAEFVDYISECTNISVGYQNEHKVTETQDIKYLEILCHALVKVDWENLPAVRDPKRVEYKDNLGYSSRRKWSSSACSAGTETLWDGKAIGKSYNQYDDWYDDSYHDFNNVRWKKNTKKQETKRDDYFDNLDYYDVETKSKKYYESLKQYIFEDELTKEEFEKIKGMYLDLNDPGDMDFYLEMKDSL
jgi:hypothetical protein